MDQNRAPINRTSQRNEGSLPGRNTQGMESQGQWTSKGRGFQSRSDSGSNAWNSRDIRPSRGRGQERDLRTEGNVSTGPAEQMSSHGNSSRFPHQQHESESFPDLVQVKKCDLFAMDPEYALAHCVGSDFIMSSGVAVQFRKTFRHVPELLDQNKNPGQVAFLVSSKEQYIYYLVTKLESTGKPKWEDFEKSVIEWSKLCVEHGVKKIAIPKIGCGRDQLDWNRVKNLLNKQFANKGVEIVVCMIDQENAPEKKWSLKLCHTKEPLSCLDSRDCALVFIASKDKFITDSIRRLGTKYGMISDFTGQELCVGNLYVYRNKATHLFGLVVKERHTDPISFAAVGKCLQQLRKDVKKSKLYYMGFEAFDDDKFQLVTRKLWTMVIDTFFTEDIEVYFCWPEAVKEKNWEIQKSF